MPTQLPAPPPTTGRHAASPPPAARPRHGFGVLAVAVLALLAGGTATATALVDPDPAATPPSITFGASAHPGPLAAPAPLAPTGRPEPTGRPAPVDPANRITITALPLVGACPRAGCTMHHVVTNHAAADATGTFTLAVGGQVVSAVALTVPAEGSVEVATRIPGTVLAAHRERRVPVDAEFRWAAAGRWT